MIVNMEAKLLVKSKQLSSDGSIKEIVIWEVPKPILGSTHLYKYRLFFGKSGKRIVGFDNERGKGDHCHLDGIELPYQFTSMDKLLDDFGSEIEKRNLRK